MVRGACGVDLEDRITSVKSREDLETRRALSVGFFCFLEGANLGLVMVFEVVVGYLQLPVLSGDVQISGVTSGWFFVPSSEGITGTPILRSFGTPL